ncbi:MAG: MoxR family ATPase [Candidatus Bipolaricaulota bacterium]|nr:MoxR family ATPase [Candidatus Bipolaricaulota bacterium]
MIPIPKVEKTARRIVDEVSKAVIGKYDVLTEVMATILAGGHILFEDNPGLAKTLIARSFARVLGVDFRRIQFTPDLLPSDITGSHIYDRNRNEFIVAPGPIFAHVILADEVNRATPKTQSAMLEAMQELQVSITGDTRPLPKPFIVMATQNPIEYEGTFPLPEAQLDRFMVRLSVGYPEPPEEAEILRRRAERKEEEVSLSAISSAEELLEMQRTVEDVVVDEDVRNYIVSLVGRTRKHTSVYVGASPRGSLALFKLSRAWAALYGRDYVLPDDVKRFAVPALAHRLILRPEFWSRQASTSDVVQGIVQATPVPKVS